MLKVNLHPDWYQGEPIKFNKWLKATDKEIETVAAYFKKKLPHKRNSPEQVNVLRSLIPNLQNAYKQGVNLEYYIGKDDKARRTVRDKMISCGLIAYYPGAKFTKTSAYTSKMKPLPLFNDLFNPLIRITTKDSMGNEIKVRGEDPVMMDRIFKYNEFMAAQSVTDENGNPLATNLYRTHKVIGGHEYKGRFQQSSYQRLSGNERGQILINGKPVVRIDVTGTHPQILYHEAGLAMSENAPYDVFPQHPDIKPLAKVAMLMMINADGRKGAIAALRNAILEKPENYLAAVHCMKKHGIKLAAIYDALEKLNQPIVRHFYTQACHRLMETEASIIFETVEVIMTRGKTPVPALQVFDEIIVPADRAELGRRALELVWKKHLGLTPRVSVKGLK